MRILSGFLAKNHSVPIPMREHIREKIQCFLIQSNKIRLFYFLSVLYYRAGFFLYTKIILFLSPCIRGVCARNSFATGQWIPWESDIDSMVVVDDFSCFTQEAKVLEVIWRYHRAMNFVFPFIKHMSILNYRECSAAEIFQDPTMTYFVRAIRVGGGLRSSDFPLVPRYTIFSLRIQDWFNFLGWFQRRHLTHLIYTRRFERFFRRFTSFLPEQEDTAHLINLCAQKEQYAVNARVLEFGSRGFYAVNQIVAFLHQKAVKPQTAPSRYTQSVLFEEVSGHVSSDAHYLAEQLAEYQEEIFGIGIDPGSLCSAHPRLWIGLRSGLDQLVWSKIFVTIRKVVRGRKLCFPVYVFDIRALEVLLHTQRHWAFELYHLKNHAEFIFGRNFFSPMHYVSDCLIFRMVLSHLVAKRVDLKKIVFTARSSSLYYFACEIIRLRLFLSSQIIVTTLHELLQKTQGFSADGDFNEIVALILKKKMPRKIIYSRLREYLLRLEEEFCNNTPGGLLEMTADECYDQILRG